jgi:hypothetical protein
MRPPASTDSHRTHKQRPLADQESRRWLDVMDAATTDVPPTTRVIRVVAREGTVCEMVGHATETDRAVLDRRLVELARYRWATAAQPVLGTVPLVGPRHDDAPARTAVVLLRGACVTLRSHRAEHLPSPTATAVWVREELLPAGTLPREWMRLTTWPMEDLTPAETVVRSSTYRWRTERYPDVLKRGHRSADRPLATFNRLDRALAGYRLVAGRLLWLTYLAREQPSPPCTPVVRSAERAPLSAVHTRRRALPPTAVDLRTTVRGIAQIGGFLERRGEGEPGVQTLWRAIGGGKISPSCRRSSTRPRQPVRRLRLALPVVVPLPGAGRPLSLPPDDSPERSDAMRPACRPAALVLRSGVLFPTRFFPPRQWWVMPRGHGRGNRRKAPRGLGMVTAPNPTNSRRGVDGA